MKGVREVQIRRRLARSKNNLNVLVECAAPRPGARVWLPVSQCSFGQSEYASEEYGHQVVRIPVWLYRKTFGPVTPRGCCNHDKTPF